MCRRAMVIVPALATEFALLAQAFSVRLTVRVVLEAMRMLPFTMRAAEASIGKTRMLERCGDEQSWAAAPPQFVAALNRQYSRNWRSNRPRADHSPPPVVRFPCPCTKP